MAKARYYKFPLVPTAYAPMRALITDKAIKYEEYKQALIKIARAQRFIASPSMKMIFIVPFAPSADQKRRSEIEGQFHQTGKDYMSLTKLIDGIKHALMGDKIVLGRVDASKYWGERGQVILKNMPEQDFEYLRLGHNDNGY